MNAPHFPHILRMDDDALCAAAADGRIAPIERLRLLERPPHCLSDAGIRRAIRISAKHYHKQTIRALLCTKRVDVRTAVAEALRIHCKAWAASRGIPHAASPSEYFWAHLLEDSARCRIRYHPHVSVAEVKAGAFLAVASVGDSEHMKELLRLKDEQLPLDDELATDALAAAASHGHYRTFDSLVRDKQTLQSGRIATATPTVPSLTACWQTRALTQQAATMRRCEWLPSVAGLTLLRRCCAIAASTLAPSTARPSTKPLGTVTQPSCGCCCVTPVWTFWQVTLSWLQCWQAI